MATLAADFPSIAAAWNDPSAFNGEVIFLVNGQETARLNVQGAPDLRTCTESGLIFAANHHGFSVIDPLAGRLLMSHGRHCSLPSYSNGRIYGLTEDGLVFSEAIDFAPLAE